MWKIGKIILISFVFGVFGGSSFSLAAIFGYHQLYVSKISIAEAGIQTLSVEEDSAATEVAEKVSPAVVSIVVSKDLSSYYQGYPGYFEEEGRQEIGGGTGFIISADGLILTNRHVVQEEDAEYTVIMSDESIYQAQILSRDPVNDLAILKIEAENLTVAELGDSGELKAGQTVIAIGNTLAQYQNTLTKGVISGLARDLGGNLSNLIQTDAAINQGNSGGPLINLAGQVIGINVAIDRSELAQGIGFAIPINDAKSAIESVQKYGRIVRPMLGIRYVPLTEEIAKENGLNYSQGALIVRGSNPGQLAVIPGSPADKAGLEENDIVLEVDGTAINKDNELAKLIQNKSVGDKIKLKISHDGQEKEVEVELEEMDL